ncbi:ligase-associated DNA damage response endonuclease PdeM [Brevundimonas sp.]|jgi:DNA ligase-associated metallophosphoesterase|uniref:ligase-associated DNA damage response endonuclease PdeM n=1 Tax=Brevundimonas sp. TaxID=1871086 RepID=UPI003784EBCE
MTALKRTETWRMTLSPSRSRCGGLHVTIAGERCVMRCSGALHVLDHDVLIAADLHLEKGSAYAARGQMLPPYDSAATLSRLEDEIAELNPARVVLLGDSFHDRRSIPRMAESDLRSLERMAFGRDWLWLEGNHDRDALGADLDRLPGSVIETLSLGTLRLVHEPQAGDQPGEVAGHLHPAATVVAHARRVRRPCFITDGQRVILPAFGAFTGGLNVRDPAIAALFASPPLAAALGRDRVHPIAWGALV